MARTSSNRYPSCQNDKSHKPQRCNLALVSTGLRTGFRATTGPLSKRRAKLSAQSNSERQVHPGPAPGRTFARKYRHLLLLHRTTSLFTSYSPKCLASKHHLQTSTTKPVSRPKSSCHLLPDSSNKCPSFPLKHSTALTSRAVFLANTSVRAPTTSDKIHTTFSSEKRAYHKTRVAKFNLSRDRYIKDLNFTQ